MDFQILVYFPCLHYPVRHPNHANVSTLFPHLKERGNYFSFLQLISIFIFLCNNYLLMPYMFQEEHSVRSVTEYDSRFNQVLQTQELRHVQNQPRQLADEEHSHDHQEDQRKTRLRRHTITTIIIQLDIHVFSRTRILSP